MKKLSGKAELFGISVVYISEHAERRIKMKKISLIIVLLMSFFIISCQEEPQCGGTLPEITVSESEEITQVAETGEIMTSILVDWSDFVRVNGVAYDGGWENREVDVSRIGEKLGEVLYTVKSYYESEEEFRQADKHDFTAAFRPIGSEIFAVKDDENSIAVLDGGKYYLYSYRSFVDFEVYGGERNGLPIADDKSFGAVINSFEELCKTFGGEENVPEEVKTRYSGKFFDDATLIVVGLVSGWGGTEYGISSVEQVGSDIHVYARQFDSDADGDDAMHYWTFYIETDKTQGKNVVLYTDKCEPLKNDTELHSVTYEQINKYILYAPDVDLGLYDGKPATNKYAAEEIARSICNYSGHSVFIRYCPTNNYWLVELTHSDGSGTYVKDIVIRAADGKVISQIETVGCT